MVLCDDESALLQPENNSNAIPSTEELVLPTDVILDASNVSVSLDNVDQSATVNESSVTNETLVQNVTMVKKFTCLLEDTEPAQGNDAPAFKVKQNMFKLLFEGTVYHYDLWLSDHQWDNFAFSAEAKSKHHLQDPTRHLSDHAVLCTLVSFQYPSSSTPKCLTKGISHARLLRN